MEHEGSLPHSQDPVTCPYPKPEQSSPWPHPTSWRSILILTSHLPLCPSSNTLYAHLSSSLYVLHTPPISFLISSPEQYLTFRIIDFSDNGRSTVITYLSKILSLSLFLINFTTFSGSVWVTQYMNHYETDQEANVPKHNLLVLVNTMAAG